MKRFLALILALFLTLSLAATAQAAKRPGASKMPTTYTAKLHVAGGVTITSTHDGLVECSPGQAWTMIEKADLVINDVVTVQGFRGIVSSTPARDPGAVQQRSRIKNYRTTNNCPPTSPAKLVKPKCSNLTGTGIANLTFDPRRNGKVSLGITRRGGGRQDLSCVATAIDSTPFGSAISALQAPFMPISLPLNVTARKFKRLKAGKSVISRMEIGGRCESAVVAPLRSFDKASTDTCHVDGTFNVMVRRIGD